MTDRNRRRTTERFAIDADLLAELEAEAAEKGLPVERHVEQMLAVTLPAVLTEVMTDYVNRSIHLASELDTTTEGAAQEGLQA